MNNPLPLDAQGNPILTTDWAASVDKTMTFSGATPNDPGDFDGTGNPATLFTVTGTVLLRILAKCTVDLAGANATVEVGTALLTTGLIPLTTGTDIDANEIWHDATPDSSLEATTVLTQKIVSQNVIQTVRTANVTSGVIVYTALWYPLSAGASVVAA
jgi:hypothetical protein